MRIEFKRVERKSFRFIKFFRSLETGMNFTDTNYGVKIGFTKYILCIANTWRYKNEE